MMYSIIYNDIYIQCFENLSLVLMRLVNQIGPSRYARKLIDAGSLNFVTVFVESVFS